MDDMIAKDRQDHRGLTAPVFRAESRERERKLGDDEVRAIRAAWDGGTSMIQLGKRYSVQHTTIRKIVRFRDRYYAHVR